jgi:hypothetical protein
VNDPNLAFSFTVRYDQQSGCGGLSEAQKANLALRVLGVWNRNFERVAENRRGFREIHTVLCDVPAALSGSHVNSTTRVYRRPSSV